MLTGIITFVIPVNSAICFDISSCIDEVAGSTETLVEKSRCDDFDRGAFVTASRLAETSSSCETIDVSSASAAARETLACCESAVCSDRFAMRCVSPSDAVYVQQEAQRDFPWHLSMLPAPGMRQSAW